MNKLCTQCDKKDNQYRWITHTDYSQATIGYPGSALHLCTTCWAIWYYYDINLMLSSLLLNGSCADQDGAEPSSNSVSAHNLLRLAAIMDSSAYRERAEAIFAVFAKRLETLPVAVPEMLRALMLHSLPVQQVCRLRSHYFLMITLLSCVALFE